MYFNMLFCFTKDKDVEKKISSSSVPNGGRKGPTSGGWQSNLSLSPVNIPMPIPKNKKNNRQKKNHRNGKARNAQKNKRIGKTKEKTEQKRPRASGVHPSASKQHRSDIKLLDSSEVVQRMRRDVEEESFSDEERMLRDEWLNFDHHENNIPSKEHVNFIPDRTRYIYETDVPYEEEEGGFEEQYYASPKVKGRLQKRSLEEENDVDDNDVTVNEDITSQSDEDEDDVDYRTIEKRDVGDYDDLTDGELITEEETPRYVRDVLPEDEYNDVMEIIEDTADYREPIRHTIVTREAPGNYGRSVRFE